MSFDNNAVTVAPVTNPSTLYMNNNGELLRKEDLFELQLPKRHKLALYIELHKNYIDPKKILDESEYFTSSKYKVSTIKGSHKNIKITFPTHKLSIT